jgi:hypothetical protein
MLRRAPTLVMSASVLILLTGCADSTSGVIDIGDPPPGLVACTIETVPALPGDYGTPFSKAQAAQAIGEQRMSALAKDKCASDWLAHYNDLRAALTLKGVSAIQTTSTTGEK